MYLPISSWFVAYALTLLVEVPVVLAMLRHQEPNLARLAVLVVFVNSGDAPRGLVRRDPAV